MKFNSVTTFSKILAMILFIALPFIGFYLGIVYQKAIAPVFNNLVVQSPSPTVTQEPSPVPSLLQTKVITSYQNNTLSYSGKVILPSPCHELEQDVLIMESFPEQIKVNLTSISPSPDKVCIQVISEKEFSGEIPSVSSDAKLTVYLDGTPLD